MMLSWPSSHLLAILSVPPIIQRHAAVACVRGSGWAELNAALQSEDFMRVIGAAGLNRQHNHPKPRPKPEPLTHSRDPGQRDARLFVAPTANQ